MELKNSKFPTLLMTFLLICSFTVTIYAQNSVIVPAYIYPKVEKAGGVIEDSHDWNILYNMAQKYKDRLLVVVNPFNGPGTAVDQNYVDAINKIKGFGGKVAGYVHVCYAINKTNGTCSGRTEQDVRDDIDNWKAWYDIDGIFLDEATSNPHQDSINWMLGVTDYAGQRFGWDYNVINYGTVPPRGYWASHGTIHSGIHIVLENSIAFYDNFKNNIPVTEYEVGLILHTCKHDDPARIKSDAKAKKIKWIYLTQDIMPNPYDRIPYFLESQF